MTNYSRDTLYNVCSLVGPCVAAPIGMWSGMLNPLYNLCRDTLCNTRTGT